VTSAGNAVGTGPVVAHAIWAHGRSQPMQPSNAMATSPRRSQIATSTIPMITRLLMTSLLKDCKEAVTQLMINMQKGAKQLGEFLKSSSRHLCLPDTVDPPGRRGSE
jgi:hypothetical protein